MARSTVRVHWTLRPVRALVLAVVTGTLASVVVVLLPRAAITVAVGAIGGAVVGALQARSILAAGAAFRAADSALAVRRALVSTATGRPPSGSSG